MDVKELQIKLMNLGFDPGPIDGVSGPLTRAAIVAFQRSRNLIPDGSAGPLTMAALQDQVMTNPAVDWLTIARKYIGVHETSGPHHNQTVVHFWQDGKAGDVNDDETPWCAAFVSAVLELAGIKSARSGWARSYLNWGRELSEPVAGCVVIFSRGSNSGHVGFVVGHDRAGKLMVLGGNQSDAVNIKAFWTGRVIGYRWPSNIALPEGIPLPILKSGELSQNEA